MLKIKRFFQRVSGALRRGFARVPRRRADWEQTLSALQPLTTVVKAPKGQRLSAVAALLGMIGDRLNRFFSKRGYAFWGKLSVTTLTSWFLADVLAILLESLLPDPGLAARGLQPGTFAARKTLQDYEMILTRNLFNSAGKIPGEGQGQPVNVPKPLAGGPAVRTSLPLDLVGTLVLSNEALSVATIANRPENQAYPVRKGDQIPNLLQVTRIESAKVTFLNLRSNQLEFVDLPEDSVKAPRVSAAQAPAAGGGVTRNQNRFTVSKDRIDSTLSDLSKVLTQARAIPHFENGKPAGFRLIQIVPGSIYEDLGLQNNDILREVNGDLINDPGKAFSLMSELKAARSVEITVSRGGKDVNFSYDIQ